MTLSVLVLRYTAFAVIATIANLGIQRLVLTQGDDGMTFALAVGAGTLVGLVISTRSVSAGEYTAPPAQGPKMTDSCGTTPDARTLRLKISA